MMAQRGFYGKTSRTLDFFPWKWAQHLDGNTIGLLGLLAIVLALSFIHG